MKVSIWNTMFGQDATQNEVELTLPKINVHPCIVASALNSSAQVS